MATLFDEAGNPVGESNDSFLDQYVGEGKKYKDVEELAKAYHNADNFIPKLKADLDGLKEFTLAQLAERAAVNNERPPESNTPNGQQTPPLNPVAVAPPKVDEEVNLDERIKQALEDREQETRLRKNSQITEEAMINHFGSKEAAVEAIRAKAEELNVSTQWLADSAFQSPTAFFNVMGISEEKPRSSNTPNSASDVNPRAIGETFGGPKPNTYAWYENIRHTDPKRYRRPDLQKQLMDDAMRLGNDFFKR